MFPNLLAFRRTILSGGISMHQSYLANAALLRATVNGGTLCWITRSPEQGVEFLNAFIAYQKAAGHPDVKNLQLLNVSNYHITNSARDLQEKIAAVAPGVQRPLVLVFDASREQASLANGDRIYGWLNAISGNLSCQSFIIRHEGHLPNPPALETRLADMLLRVEDDQQPQLGAIPIDRVGLKLRIIEFKPGNKVVYHLKGTAIGSTVVFTQVPEAKPLVRPSSQQVSA